MCKHFLFLQFFSIKLCACSGSMINLLWNGMRNFMAPTNRRLTWMKTHRYKKRNASDIKAMITIETWKKSISAWAFDRNVYARQLCGYNKSMLPFYTYRKISCWRNAYMCASTRCTPTVHNWNSIPMMKTYN